MHNCVLFNGKGGGKAHILSPYKGANIFQGGGTSLPAPLKKPYTSSLIQTQHLPYKSNGCVLTGEAL